jgi:hypothetical protein
MDDEPRRPLPKRNPVTHQKHRQEVFWQITIPLLVGGILIVVPMCLVVLAGITGTGRLDKLASFSLIWLILIAMVLTLFALIAIAALGYLITMMVKTIPPYARQAQDTFTLIKLRVRGVSDKTVEPFLRYHSFSASLGALGRRIRRK